MNKAVAAFLLTLFWTGCANSNRVPLGSKEALFHRNLQFIHSSRRPPWSKERRDAVLVGANRSEGAHRYSTHFSEGKGDVTVGWFDGKYGKRLAPAAHPGQRTVGYYVPSHGIFGEQIWISDYTADHPDEIAWISEHEVDHVFGRTHFSSKVWKPWQANYIPSSSK
jgi:hypothetical protein